MGNFIPKSYTKLPITIRVDENNLKKVDELAAKLGISRSELINQCLVYALEDLKLKPESR